ncbi:MAG: hypothetical protein JSU01_19310 [Bacteroidetes bacterium]|nr:hypothetical protein [Bacteroidota bacterium]
MKTLLNPWFIVGCLIWTTVMITRKSGHPLPPLINGYVDDAFAIPVIANLSLCYMRAFVIHSNYYVLSAWKVTFIVIYLTFVFEIFLPLISKTYTMDWIDAALYVLGGLFFYFVMNRPLLNRKSSDL